MNHLRKKGQGKSKMQNDKSLFHHEEHEVHEEGLWLNFLNLANSVIKKLPVLRELRGYKNIFMGVQK